jgi:hypothetical protein
MHDRDVPALYVAEVAKALDERAPHRRPFPGGERNIAQDAYLKNFARRLLRTDRGRYDEDDCERESPYELREEGGSQLTFRSRPAQ